MPDTGASHGRSTNHTHTTQFSEFESSSHDECTETSRISENEPEPPTIPGSGPVTRSNVKVAWYLDGLMARLKHPLGPDTAEYDDFPFPDIQEAHEDDPEEEVLDEEDSEGSEWEDFDQEWRELQDLHSRIMNGIEEINEIALSRPLISAPEASASSEAVPGAEAPKEQAMPVGWSKDELKQMYAVKKRMVRHLVAWHSLREKTLNSFKGSRASLGNGFRKGDGVEG